MGFPFECRIRQIFSGKKLVRETLVANASSRFSELISMKISSTLFAKHSKKGVICYIYSKAGHVSRDCLQREQGRRNSDTSNVSSSSSNNSSADTSGTCNLCRASSTYSYSKVPNADHVVGRALIPQFFIFLFVRQGMRKLRSLLIAPLQAFMCGLCLPESSFCSTGKRGASEIIMTLRLLLKTLRSLPRVEGGVVISIVCLAYPICLP